jgi:hypothetical protein
VLLAITVMSLVPLYPHCVCYNAANAWWIDRLGASPECYVWGLMASVVAVGGLCAGGKRSLVSAVVSWSIIGGALAFFVGHHYFGFPW